MNLVIPKNGFAVCLAAVVLTFSGFLTAFAQTIPAQPQTAPAPEAHDVIPLGKIPEIGATKEAGTTSSASEACNRIVPADARKACSCNALSNLNYDVCKKAVEDSLLKTGSQAAADSASSFSGKAREVYDLVKSCLASTSNQSSCIANAQPIKDELIKTKNNCLNQNAGNKGGGATGNCSVCKDYYKAAVSNGSVNIFSASCGGSCVQINSGGNIVCESVFEQDYEAISSAEDAATGDWRAAAGAGAAAANAAKTKAGGIIQSLKVAVEAAAKAVKPVSAPELKPQVQVAPETQAQPVQEAAAPKFKLIETFNKVKKFFITPFLWLFNR